MTAVLTRFGFDPMKLPFAMRTAIAACLALVVAWLVGLEHPQWSAMTVWTASQPLRGHLLEKSAARVCGTIIGALFGVVLMIASHGQLVVLVVGISLWLGLCALVGNLVRGYASYAAMLSGYSAAMVALLDSAHPDHILHLGSDRVLTVVLGVVAALAVGWFFAAPGDDTTVSGGARHLTARILADVAACLDGRPITEGEQRSILGDIARLEGTLDGHAAGSRRSRHVVARLRTLLNAHVAAVLWLRTHAGRKAPAPMDARTIEAWETAGNLAATGGPPATAAIRAALALPLPPSGLKPVLEDLASAYGELETGRPESGPRPPLHRDWIGARHAMTRATATMLAVGALWLLSGWSLGGFMMLGTAIMTSIFSTFENPSRMLLSALIGQALGVLAALGCRWLVWPFAGAEAALVLTMMPFVLIGAGLAAHRRTERIAFDYNMVFLLMLQPVWPQVMTFDTSLMASFAVMVAPLAGLAAFRLIYPVDSRRRYEAVRIAMLDDLERLAGSATEPLSRRAWQALLHHRVLLAVWWGERSAHSVSELADNALAILQVGLAIETLGTLSAARSSTSARRRIPATLRRLRKIGHDPLRAARALTAAARTLERDEHADIRLLREAAAKIESRPAVFLRRRTL
ncbi:MAG: FUSC family protein [Xanthobacteraceae bacterium]|nr:FUSC family protein [Xanthobacteraceae bacterium]